MEAEVCGRGEQVQERGEHREKERRKDTNREDKGGRRETKDEIGIRDWRKRCRRSKKKLEREEEIEE